MKDSLVGLKDKPFNESYLFPPNSIASYNTSEFHYDARINSYGLRDKEYKSKSNKTRILFIGDSFTFGWGVENEYSVPKQLEKILNKNLENKKFEVINCGKGGSGVSDYVNAIKTYSKIYNPDYVFIGFLQLDDLAQEYEKWFADSLSRLNLKITSETSPSKIQMFLKDLKDVSVGNIIRKINNKENLKLNVKNNYKNQAKSMFDSFNNYQKMKFSMLDQKLKYMFLNGDLNPSLINIYVNFPERTLVYNNPTLYVTQKAIKLTKEKFKEIKEVSKLSGFKVIVFNFPINYFTGHNVIRSNFDIMFNKILIHNNKIDSIYRDISKSVNFSYLNFTDEFYNYQNKDVLYFKYDGHMTPKGNSFLTNCIYNQIKDQLK